MEDFGQITFIFPAVVALYMFIQFFGFRNTENTGHRYISVFMFLLSLLLIVKTFYNFRVFPINFVYPSVNAVISLTFPVFLYFAARHYIEKDKISPFAKWYHFLPAAFMAILHAFLWLGIFFTKPAGSSSITFFSQSAIGIKIPYYMDFLTNSLIILQMGLYTIRLTSMIRKKVRSTESESLNIKLSIVFLLLFLGMVTVYILSLWSQSQFFANYLHPIVLFIFISVFGYFGIRETLFIEGLKQERKKEFEIVKDYPIDNHQMEEIQICETNKYSKSCISEEKVCQLVLKIKEIMVMEALYRNPDLSIDDIAKKISVNRNYISQAINEHEGLNFPNFVNQYRIKDAMKILSSRDAKNYTMQGLAEMVGFKSKSPFNNAFKKLSGLTPSDYQKKMS